MPNSASAYHASDPRSGLPGTRAEKVRADVAWVNPDDCSIRTAPRGNDQREISSVSKSFRDGRTRIGSRGSTGGIGISCNSTATRMKHAKTSPRAAESKPTPTSTGTRRLSHDLLEDTTFRSAARVITLAKKFIQEHDPPVWLRRCE